VECGFGGGVVICCSGGERHIWSSDSIGSATYDFRVVIIEGVGVGCVVGCWAMFVCVFVPVGP
jgi:hypothetical protein